MLREEIDNILDRLPEDELENVLTALKHIESKYLNTWNLFGKGVGVTPILEDSEQIIASWDYHFAGHIPATIKRDIYYNEYKWHMFSYEKQQCLKEEEARRAFNELHKDELYVMYQRSPYVTLLTNASKITAEDFDKEQDVYLFDKHFTWTYVQTHEEACGPYFLLRS